MPCLCSVECYAYAASIDVCLSVCLSVTVMDCDLVMRQKLVHCRIDRCRGYLHDEADPDRNILWPGIVLILPVEYG